MVSFFSNNKNRIFYAIISLLVLFDVCFLYYLFNYSVIEPLEMKSRILSLTIFLFLIIIGIILIFLDSSLRYFKYYLISKLSIIIGFLRIEYSFDFFNHAYYQSLTNRYRDSKYLVNDWCLNSSEKFNPYLYFSKFFALFSVEVEPVVYYIAWILLFVGLILFYYFFSKRNFPKISPYLIAILSLFFAVLTFRGGYQGLFELGENDFFYHYLNPQSIALLFVFFGIFAFIINRVVVSGILVGLALILHLNTGQHALILLFFITIFNKEIPLKNIFITGFFSFLIGLPNLIPVFLDQFPIIFQKHLSPLNYILITGWFRIPHHLILSSWSIKIFIYFIFFIVIGFVAFNKTNSNTKWDNSVKIIVYTTIILCFFSWFFIEIIPVDFIAKLQLYRLTVIVKVLLIPYIIYYMIKLLKFFKEKYVKRFTFDHNLFFYNEKKLLYFSFIFLIGVGLIFFGKQDDIYEKPAKDIENWVRNNTQENSLFVIPFDRDFREFMLKTDRAVVVDFKRNIFQGLEYIEWYKRICDILGSEYVSDIESVKKLRKKMLSGYTVQDKLKIIRIKEKYNVTYFLVHKKYSIKGLEPVYRDEKYLIYDLRKL